MVSCQVTLWSCASDDLERLTDGLIGWCYRGTTTALKKSKERFENEMAELGSSRDMSGKESEAAGRISGLERKIQYVTADKVCLLYGGVVMRRQFGNDSNVYTVSDTFCRVKTGWG